jgi:amino acid transporter
MSSGSPSSVRAHSAELRKELGLRDLVFTQVLFVAGFTNLGTAAKLGPSHVVFWLLAVVFFYIPLAMVVIHLSQWRPLEGGLYQWSSAAFGELTGFLVAWNLWLYAIAFMSELGLVTATGIAYVLGPSAAWLAESKWFITATSIALVAGMVWVSVVGLRIGKWIYNAGGVLVMTIFTALLFVLAMHPHAHTMSFTLPPLTLLNMNILGKLAFVALGGFEYVAVFAGECRDPERTIGRSVIIAAPIIAAIFILGTSAVLSVVPPEAVDLVNPVAQVLSIAARPFGIAAQVVAVLILLKLGSSVAQTSISFAVNSRLPMVAGWDALLPVWFTRLHPRYRTPVNSIFVVGAVTLLLGLASISGARRQEAFQLLSSALGIFYALAYLVMFAIPISGRSGAPMRLRWASGSAFSLTLLCAVLSIFPIVDVPSPLTFSAKVGSLLVATNLAGALLFWSARKRKTASAQST